MSATDVDRKKAELDAVIAVHMFGNPADLDSICAVAGNRPIVEDCAQALFSTYKGRATGLSSVASFFSFRSGKYISAGDGSAIVCLDTGLRDDIRDLVDQFPAWRLSSSMVHYVSMYVKSALYRRPWYGLLGYPIGRRLDRMMNLSAKSGLDLRKIAEGDQASIAGKIRMFERNIRRQRENARYLIGAIDGAPIVLVQEREGCASNCYQFAVRFGNSRQRDRTAEYLLEHGIDTARYMDGIGELAGSAYGYDGDCPNAEACSQTILVIPHNYTLQERSLRHIARRLNEAANVHAGTEFHRASI